MTRNWRLSIAVAVSLLSLGGTAEADILTAGPVYGGSGQLSGSVFCWLFNTGSTTVTVSYRQIWNSVKGSVALTGDTCNVSLAAGKSCDYSVGAGTGTYTCRAVTNGIEDHVSGAMQIYTSSDQLLLTLPMSK